MMLSTSRMSLVCLFFLLLCNFSESSKHSRRLGIKGYVSSSRNLYGNKSGKSNKNESYQGHKQQSYRDYNSYDDVEAPSQPSYDEQAPKVNTNDNSVLVRGSKENAAAKSSNSNKSTSRIVTTATKYSLAKKADSDNDHDEARQKVTLDQSAKSSEDDDKDSSERESRNRGNQKLAKIPETADRKRSEPKDGKGRLVANLKTEMRQQILMTLSFNHIIFVLEQLEQQHTKENSVRAKPTFLTFLGFGCKHVSRSFNSLSQ